MDLRQRLAIALLVCAPLVAQAQGPAHEHGLARLDIAVEGQQIVVQLESPLDNLLGFERAPRSDAERQRVDAAVARLRAGETMFRFDPAAGCKLAWVELTSAVLQLGPPGATATGHGHAEIEATWQFGCADAAKAAFVDTGLFAFGPLERVQVQLALPRGQFKRELKRPAARIVLGP